jgi:hypothetical protein
MVSFLLGILSGIITSLSVSAIFSTFTSLRKFIPPKLRKSFDKEFKNQECAEKSIIKDAKKSTFMHVFTLKGGSFCNKVTGRSKRLNEIFENIKIEQKYLISAQADKNPYVAIRSRELDDGATLNNGIGDSITYLELAQADPNRKIQFHLHTEIVRFRLIIFDEYLYVSYQSKNIKGNKSPVQRYHRKSSGYSAMSAFFDDKWLEYSKKTSED